MSAFRNDFEAAMAEAHLLDSAYEHVGEWPQDPERFVELGLLAYPEAFGDALVEPLSKARESVLREGDEQSRELLAALPWMYAEVEIARIKRVLAGRPTAAESAAPALVHLGGSLVIALAHRVPCGGDALAVRAQVGAHPEILSMRATRIEPSADLLMRWAALGHADLPHSVWHCEPPSWIEGFHSLAIEVMPNPRGFQEAMVIAHRGAGRVLVPRIDGNATAHEAAWMSAAVMPSGWSYLRADRTMGSSRPSFPHGAPHVATHVRVPDAEIFAQCAVRTWTASLCDAIWLDRVLDYSRRLARLNAQHGGETT
jgi:hypothetical protein